MTSLLIVGKHNRHHDAAATRGMVAGTAFSARQRCMILGREIVVMAYGSAHDT